MRRGEGARFGDELYRVNNKMWSEASQVEITLLLVDPYGRNTTKADI